MASTHVRAACAHRLLRFQTLWAGATREQSVRFARISIGQTRLPARELRCSTKRLTIVHKA